MPAMPHLMPYNLADMATGMPNSRLAVLPNVLLSVQQFAHPLPGTLPQSKHASSNAFERKKER